MADHQVPHGRVLDAVATRTPDLRPWQYRALAMLIGGTAVIALIIASATVPASGQSSIEMGSLNVSGTNQTVDGNVSNVGVSTDLKYSYEVPDATRTLVKLRAGPSKDDMETVTFEQNDEPGGSGTDTTTLSGSLTDTSYWSAADFNPELAGTSTKTLVVGAMIEVRRSGGDTVTKTVYDTVTISLEDGATLSADVGGEGSVSVTTE